MQQSLFEILFMHPAVFRPVPFPAHTTFAAVAAKTAIPIREEEEDHVRHLLLGADPATSSRLYRLYRRCRQNRYSHS